MTTAPSRHRATTPERRAWSDIVLTRLVNPVVCTLLRSPLHDLLSDGVALLQGTGRRSGRWLAVPVNYLLEEDDIVLVSRRRRRW